MNIKFWLKTLMHTVTPGGFGHERSLREFKDSSYVHDRDKNPIRDKHAGGKGWSNWSGGIRGRSYESYDEYKLHQSLKFDEILKMKGGFSNTEILSYRIKFYNRFKYLSSYLPYSSRILCAGARQGTEVDVLRDLGFHNSYGIDLNPGPNNPLVIKGDFLNIQEPDRSIDLIYSNALDHSFNLEKMFSEHSRVLTDTGYVLYDIPLNNNYFGGAFEAIDWKQSSLIVNEVISRHRVIHKLEREKDWVWLLCQSPKKGTLI